MTATPFTETLVVPGPDSLPALVPHLVGFLPSSSLVLVGLSGPEHRVRVTLRSDLPPRGTPPDEACGDLRRLVPAVLRAGADSALLVVYPRVDDDPWGDPEPRDLPHRDLVVEHEAVLDELGLHLADAVCVVGERVRSYRCDDLVCCPPEGRVVSASESLRIRAALVAAGSAPLASREALAARLATRATDDPVREAVDRTRALLGDCDGLMSVADVDSFLLGLTAWGAHEGPSRLLEPLTAMAVPLCQRIRPRDLLLRALSVEATPEQLALAREVLAEGVRCAEPEETAPVAAVLAVVAWLTGDGAFARVALDRALASDPAYSLAALVSAALDHGTPPWEWAVMMRDLSVEAILEATAPAYDDVSYVAAQGDLADSVLADPDLEDVDPDLPDEDDPEAGSGDDHASRAV
jgi:hypothetical protein